MEAKVRTRGGRGVRGEVEKGAEGRRRRKRGDGGVCFLNSLGVVRRGLERWLLLSFPFRCDYSCCY